MICGGTPAVAQPTMRPSGFQPRSFAIFARVTITAAAPSTMPLAFPGVTMPSLRNAGCSASSTSIVIWAAISSSVTIVVFFPFLTSPERFLP